MRPFLIAAVVAALGCTPAVAATPKSPDDFLTNAMKGDNSEIALGQLAEHRGQSAGVRRYGRTLATDHANAKQEVTELGGRMGAKPTEELADEAKAEFKKLSAMSGADFDREFVRYMVADHRQDISDFETQTKAKDQTAGLAQHQLPTLRKHLNIALHLQSSRAASSRRSAAHR